MVQLSDEYTPAELSSIILVFMKALKFKDVYTFGHSERVGRYSESIARAMNLSADQVETSRILGQLHDIGKLFVPDNILLKPAGLNGSEWETMRRHSTDSVRVLSCMGVITEYLNVVRSFHERFDGTGYPGGLEGAQINIISRIVSVADSYDAMITDRPYRKAQTIDYVYEELTREKGKQYCPDVVDVTIKLVEKKTLLQPAQNHNGFVREPLIALPHEIKFDQ